MSGWRVYGAAELARLEGAWAKAEAAGRGTVFQTFLMARQWAAAYAGAAELHLLAAESAPVILPLAVRDGCLSLVGEGLFDYSDAIGDAGGLDARLRAGAEAAIAGLEWTEARITGVPARSGFAPLWRAIAAEEEFAAALQRPAAAPALARAHPRYARRWRGALRRGWELRRETDARERSAALDWLLERKAEDFGAGDVLGERERRWLAGMVAEAPEVAEVWTLRAGGQRLAGLLSWRWMAARYAYTISYDLRAAAHSPGVLLLYAVVCRSQEEGLGFDFLTGEQEFKRHFASEATPLRRYRRAGGPAPWNS